MSCPSPLLITSQSGERSGTYSIRWLSDDPRLGTRANACIRSLLSEARTGQNVAVPKFSLRVTVDNHEIVTPSQLSRDLFSSVLLTDATRDLSPNSECPKNTGKKATSRRVSKSMMEPQWKHNSLITAWPRSSGPASSSSIISNSTCARIS